MDGPRFSFSLYPLSLKPMTPKMAIVFVSFIFTFSICFASIYAASSSLIFALFTFPNIESFSPGNVINAGPYSCSARYTILSTSAAVKCPLLSPSLKVIPGYIMRFFNCRFPIFPGLKRFSNIDSPPSANQINRPISAPSRIAYRASPIRLQSPIKQ